MPTIRFNRYLWNEELADERWRVETVEKKSKENKSIPKTQKKWQDIYYQRNIVGDLKIFEFGKRKCVTRLKGYIRLILDSGGIWFTPEWKSGRVFLLLLFSGKGHHNETIRWRPKKKDKRWKKRLRMIYLVSHTSGMFHYFPTLEKLQGILPMILLHHWLHCNQAMFHQSACLIINTRERQQITNMPMPIKFRYFGSISWQRIIVVWYQYYKKGFMNSQPRLI